jgi:hypothetical protein
LIPVPSELHELQVRPNLDSASLDNTQQVHTMHEYFKNLDTVDPLFHALVLSRIRTIQERDGLEVVSIDSLTEEDELEILREYCMTLYKEYRTLRTIFLENMQVSGRAVGFKHSTN